MPTEDFTTYTEVDVVGDRLSVVANTVTTTLFQSRTETAYVDKDKGVGFFAGDFTHKFQAKMTLMGNVGVNTFWMLNTVLGDHYAQFDNNGDAVLFWAYDDAETLLTRIVENGVGISDSWPPIPAGPQLNTTYYVTVIRDDDGGVNNTGRVTTYICTGDYYGEAGSTLKDTLIVDCSAGEQNDYRYVTVASGYDNNTGPGVLSGSISYLELVVVPIPVAMHHYKQMGA